MIRQVQPVALVALLALLPAKALAQAAPDAPGAPLVPSEVPSEAPSTEPPAAVDGGAPAAAPVASGDAPVADAPSAAAPVDAPPSSHDEPVEVRVIGSKASALQRTPGSGTLITAQDFKRAEPHDVAEMLRRVPGVQVRQEEGGGFRLDIGIRGLDSGRSRRVLVLEDGIPVAINPYAEADLYYAPPVERMRGIEVVKGSGSILFGPQTIGGVINFLTLTPPPRDHATADVEYGQFNTMRGLASFGSSVGSARYVVQAFHKRSDGLRGNPWESTDVFGKIAFDTSSKGEATVKIGFHDDAAHSEDIGLTRAMYAEDPRRTTLAPLDQLHQRRYEASLVHEQRFDADTKLRTLVYAYETSRIWRRQTFSSSPLDGYEHAVGLGETDLGGAIYFAYADTVLDRSYDVAGIEPRLEHRMKTGPLGHTLDVGARLLGETAHYQQRSGTLADSYSGSLDAEETHRTVAIAGYVQDAVTLGDSLVVTPGLRLEHAAFHRLILREGGADVPNKVGDFAVTSLIPGVGAVAGSRDLHAFAGVHVGWAPPRVASSFSAKGTPTQVDAEESVNYEVGGRATLKKWLRGEVTGFYSRFGNQVVTGTAAQGSELVNGGPTQHIGAEAGTTVGIGKALGWGTTVDVGARYTFARATFVGGTYDGNLLPYAPLQSVSANLDVEHASGVGGQIAYAHVSSQFADANDTRIENVTGEYGLIPARNIVDVTAHYHHKPTRLTLRVSVKNALDDVYISARRPQGIFVAGFRQILVGLRWEWEAKAESAE
jgi:Fe(3+) dicitrate transport protein